MLRFLVNTPNLKDAPATFDYSSHSIIEILFCVYLFHSVPRIYSTNQAADQLLLRESNYWIEIEHRSLPHKPHLA